MKMRGLELGNLMSHIVWRWWRWWSARAGVDDTGGDGLYRS